MADTSPLIFLSKLDRLDLLRKAADEILVPHAVVQEIRQRPDWASQKIEDALKTWVRVEPTKGQQLVNILLADLDEGEAEAIVLALEVGAERIVMDDLDGRRLARRVGLESIGTLGLLLTARRRGELASLREEIERLQRVGFRVSDSVVRTVLLEAGEA